MALPNDLKGFGQFNLAMERQLKKCAAMPGKFYSVVGVAQNLGNEPFNTDICIPYSQSLDNSIESMRFMNLVVRPTVNPAAFVDPLSKAVWQVDQNLPISKAS